ncbi:SAVED domain-containing protein [Tahibacter amnicola]|uniref:SAVED domain-containing protein n=1 Tax=Tahibacter amnicola TaxID=2976241 RepID=A0ABY6B7N8_9GAMM|nr:SAVED domain-containing protein [Tahibacter amnicola]UXI66019.1 SAVED domain-containing protein [Tahibacter amnicola]
MSHHKRLLLLLGISIFRTTSEEEAVASLTDEEARLPRTILRLDTRELDPSVTTGFWSPVEARVRTFAKQVLADLDQNGPAMVRYIGLDEVPTLVALSAFLGDEHRIECRDLAVDTKRFEWLEQDATVAFDKVGEPRDVIEAARDVTLRIEVSFTVHAEHVDQVIAPSQRIADVTVRPRGVTPIPGLLQSQADVERVRVAVREVLAELDRTRPGIQTIHLFLAGPVSVCLAVGQELRLRNGRRVQTYRYRSDATPAQTPAILLTPRAGEEVQRPLTADEVARADTIRERWREALKQVYEHAQVLKTHGSWPGYLAAPLVGDNPCPSDLASIWELVKDVDTISQDDVDEFSFDRTARVWFFPNRMLLDMADAGGDADRVRKLARAFFGTSICTSTST